MTRMLQRLSLACALLLLCTATVQAQGTSTVSVTPAEETEETEVFSENVVLHVDDSTFNSVRAGMPFPLAFELIVTDKPVQGTLEIAVSGRPTQKIPIKLEPPATQQHLVLGEQPTEAQPYSMFGGMTAPSMDEVTFTLRERGKVTLRRKFDLFSSNSAGTTWGEITSQVPLLNVLSKSLEHGSVVNGLTTMRFQTELETTRDYDYYQQNSQGSSEDEPRPLETDPPLIVPVRPGGYGLVGAYALWDLLFIHGQDPREWDTDRTRALQDWVLDGGVLLIAPGSGVDWNPWAPLGLDDASRIEAGARPVGPIDGVQTFLDLPPLATTSFETERYALPESMQPLVLASDGAPLLGWRRYGRGCVVATTFDVTLAQLREWPGLPALLLWMAEFGDQHRISEVTQPGLRAAQTVGVNRYYVPNTLAPGTRFFLSSFPHTYGRPAGAWRLMPTILWFIGIYALLLLLVLPWLRARRRWRHIGVVWGIACVGSLILVPLLNATPVLVRQADTTIESPAAPRQHFASATLTALRGQFDRTFALPEETIPGILIGPMDQTAESQVMIDRLDDLEKLSMVHASRLQLTHLELPLWQQFRLMQPLPTSEEAPSIGVATSELEGELLVEIDNLDPVFQPNFVMVAGARGRYSFGALEYIDPGSKWPLEIKIKVQDEQRAIADQPETQYDYWNSSQKRNYYSNPASPHRFQGQWIPRELAVEQTAMEAFVGPIRNWVDATGGLTVVLGRLEPAMRGELPEFRVWYDPTSLDLEAVPPLLRLGSTRGVQLLTGQTRLRCAFEQNGALMLIGEAHMPEGMSLLINGEPQTALQAMELEAWSPSQGWLSCPRIDEGGVAPPSWALTPTLPAADRLPIYRLRATEPVTLHQLLVPETPYRTTQKLTPRNAQ